MAGDKWLMFSWFGYGPNRESPNMVRDWPVSHRSQLRGTAYSPDEVGVWLKEQLGEYRRNLGEAAYERYCGYADDNVAAFTVGSDCMSWVVWAADRSNLLSVAVVRERPNPGSPHLSAADQRAVSA